MVRLVCFNVVLVLCCCCSLALNEDDEIDNSRKSFVTETTANANKRIQKHLCFFMSYYKKFEGAADKVTDDIVSLSTRSIISGDWRLATVLATDSLLY